MKQNLLLYVLVCMLLCSCEKNSGIKLSEEAANAIVHKNLGIDQLNIPPDGGEDGGKKDEFACVVQNNEPPMTKCEASTGNTCSKLHKCQSVLKMRESGLYTEEELKQSEEIGRMFNEVYNAGN